MIEYKHIGYEGYSSDGWRPVKEAFYPIRPLDFQYMKFRFEPYGMEYTEYDEQFVQDFLWYKLKGG